MSETEPTPEKPVPSREQAVEAFRSFVSQGYRSPDDLPLDDEAVMAANEVLDEWSKSAQERAQKDPSSRAELAYSMSRSTIHVDAGFDDPDYLDEVANDWLLNDLESAKEKGLPEMAAAIKAKRDEINARNGLPASDE